MHLQRSSFFYLRGWSAVGWMTVLGLALAMRPAEASFTLPIYLTSYLDDFLSLPLVLGVLLALTRLVHRKPQLTLSRLQGISGLLVFALYFEVILPAFNASFTSDPWDVLAYALGLVFFQLVINL